MIGVGVDDIKNEVLNVAKEDKTYRRKLFSIFLEDPEIRKWIREVVNNGN